MIRAVIFLVIITSLYVSRAQAACTLRFNKVKPGVFVKSLGFQTIILEPSFGNIVIEFGDVIEAYCSNGFKNYGSLVSKPESHLKFTCVANALRYQTSAQGVSYPARNDGSMFCEATAQYYTQTVPFCTKAGLVYGLSMRNISIVFAELCYNPRTRQVDFTHYVTGVRNDLIEDQSTFSPTNRSGVLFANNLLSTDASSIAKESVALAKAISLTGNYAGLMNYRLDNLIPLESQAGVMKPYVANIRNVTSIVWWNNLLDFNWQQVQQRIGNLSHAGGYDVYAGVSNSVHIPYENRNVTFEYKVDAITKRVPLYIWSLVKSRTDRRDPGVVIIGVNSPFFTVEKTNIVLCRDICDRIEWMSPLKSTRTIPTMGYVYCCNARDVKKILDGFPQI